ncbi:MAG: LamG domain-containing protein [Verrucomicrobia bacterium]|nr:LamG domain-containing protein [Verrucomicrobiota bacterium]
MKKQIVPITLLALLTVSANLQAAGPDAGFSAYHTRMNPSPVGHIGKYEDLVVTLGKTNRLEFARANGYLPQWRTAKDVHRIGNLISNTTEDPNCYYSYVRLMENGPDKIVVQWRRFKDAERVAKANAAMDPLDPHGITGVIQELFTIYPDGKVEREVRDASNTRYQDWIDPRLATRQNLKLTDAGIEYGPVTAGQKPPFFPRPAVMGNPVKANQGLPAPLHYWNFDDGMKPHEDQVKESASGTGCEITGLMTQFKKGVSGTALALDGYYTGVTMEAKPASHDTLTVAAWVALDTYPYNNAPLVHHSKGFGAEGWYLGLDSYGHPLVTVAGQTVKASETVLPLHQWVQVSATLGNRKIRLYVDGRVIASGDFNGTLTTPATAVTLGRNNEPDRNTEPVRGPKNNLLFLSGIQGLLDEVSIHSQALSPDQVQRAYTAMRPANRNSDLAKGVLPGELGAAKRFGAAYKSLPFSDVWDPLWRDLPGAEIVVKFDRNPCSVVYWRGTNHAPNWVTDNNRWMADQSSENGGPHGCSEHMADKQVRHSHSRIIENTPARVLIHWRYPCVDVSYINLNAKAWTDEYHAIYPDGTGVRHVVFNGRGGAPGPGFQDIQFLTNPGEAPLDVMNLQAMTVANLKGETRDLLWSLPDGVPKNTLPDAKVEVLNSKSEHKVFAMFQGGLINPWGAGEQSKYIDAPFAGPWNHWPMHLVPSDGRFAVATDRVTHFALGANDSAPKCGSMVLYGFTRQPAASLVPLAKSWNQPPEIAALAGCKAAAYRKESRDFPLVAEKESMSVRIAATGESPLVNPCFIIRNWGHNGAARVKTTAAGVKDVRQGVIIDTDGTKTMVIWLDLTSTAEVSVNISGANPKAG